MNQFYPERNISVTSRDPAFVSPDVKRMLRKKNRLMHAGRIEEAGSLSDRIGKHILSFTTSSLKGCDDITDTKTMWDMVNKLTGKKGGNVVHSSVTAIELNNHFSNISADSAYNQFDKKYTAACEQTLYISEYQAFKMLDTLKKTATGPDLLPAWFLKLGAPVFALPIATLFNVSLQSSFVPKQWKSACIVPIPKVPNPESAVDFRPISITSILSRQIEKIVVSNFIYPLYSMPICKIPQQLSFVDQFAFRPTGSTSAGIISILDCISQMLSNCKFVRVVALDFSKAFDTVRHSALLGKVSALPLPDNVNNWIVDYYENRDHCTKYGGSTTDSVQLRASVVQGSGIGPSAFTITAADLHPITNGNKLKKYADDIYLIIPATNVSSTQFELDNITKWADVNNLKLNKAKSQEIIFGTSRYEAPPELAGVCRVNQIKILGVTIDSKLKV